MRVTWVIRVIRVVRVVRFIRVIWVISAIMLSHGCLCLCLPRVFKI